MSLFPLSDPDGRTTHRSQEEEVLLILSIDITEFTERFSGLQETIDSNHLYSLGLFTTTEKRFSPSEVITSYFLLPLRLLSDMYFFPN